MKFGSVLAEHNSTSCNVKFKHDLPCKASTPFLLVPMLEHPHPRLPLQDICLSSTCLCSSNSKIQLFLKRRINVRPLNSTGTSSYHLYCKEVKENSKNWLQRSSCLEFFFEQQMTNRMLQLKPEECLPLFQKQKAKINRTV